MSAEEEWREFWECYAEREMPIDHAVLENLTQDTGEVGWQVRDELSEDTQKLYRE